MFGFLKTLLGGGEAMNAKQLIAEGALVIDVRRKDEWDGGHIASAKHMPVDELPARIDDVEQWAGGDKSRPIVVYCASGGRSGRALSILTQAGFTRVVNGGGYSGLR